MATEPIFDSAPLRLDSMTGAKWNERLATLSNFLSRALVKKLLFLGGDVLAVAAAHGIVEAAMRRILNVPSNYMNPPRYFLFYLPFFTAMLYALDAYKSLDIRRPEKDLEVVFKAVSLSFVALACANFVFFKGTGFSRYLLVCWFALTLILLLAARSGIRAAYSALWRRGFARQRALFVGPADRLHEFLRTLAIQRCVPYEMAGILTETAALQPDSWPQLWAAAEIVGSIADWEAAARATAAQVLIVNVEASAQVSASVVREIVQRGRALGIEVGLYSPTLGTAGLRYERDEFSGYFRIYGTAEWSRDSQRLVKAALDFFFGLLGSLAAILLIPIVAALLKFEDGGPLFYRQEYVGADGRLRHYLKFRTMVVNASQILESDSRLLNEFQQSFKLRHDPRVLRVGRFLRKYSLDEFPEFFSVLAGRLTFVGPRTISWAQRGRYGALLPKLLSVKPGLTGFWQVMGRQTTTYEERIQMDMFYIDHWSIWLDLVIVAKTFWEVIRASGAY